MNQDAKPYIDASLSGPGCVLLPFTEALISDDYVRWLNTPDVIRYLEVRHTRQTRETAREFVNSCREDPSKYFWLVQSKAAGLSIGTASLYLNNERASGEIGLMIGETQTWGKGVSEEIVDLIAQFAFKQLSLRRVTGGTYANNMGINFTFKRLGFKLEGVLRQCRRIDDGTYVDEFLWGALAPEWKVRHPLTLIEATT
jgi:RimJ/RimL family protein N-acetyltransferase